MNPKHLSAKEFLKQTKSIDQRIKAKMDQIAALRELAAKATSSISDMPPTSGTRNVHRMEDNLAKMVDLESEINADIAKLSTTKHEVMSVIKMVPSDEYQSLLELKYLCLKPWKDVTLKLGYGYRQTVRMHGSALEQVEKILQRYADIS
jgi:hypothetical protein